MNSDFHLRKLACRFHINDINEAVLLYHKCLMLMLIMFCGQNTKYNLCSNPHTIESEEEFIEIKKEIK